MIKIFIASSVHRWDDTRVFQKEAKSLAKIYNVELHIPAEFVRKNCDGVKIFGLPIWKSVQDRRIIRKELWNRVKKGEFDVFHFHDPELIFMGLYVQLIKRKIAIYDIHENIPLQILYKDYIPSLFLRKLISILYSIFQSFIKNIFSAIIVAGEDILEKYNRRVVIQNYPLKFQFTDNQRSVSLKDLVYIGGVSPYRGVEETLKAIRKINERLNSKKLKLNIIGSFDDFNYEEYILSEFKNEIKFHGWKKQMDSLIIARSCFAGIVLYLPIPNHMRLRSNKVFEYMIAGIPVIYSDFSDWTTKLDTHEVGLSADPENIEDIANKINYLIKHQDQIEKFGKNGRKLVKNKYNWDSQEIELFRLYQQLIDKLN